MLLILFEKRKDFETMGIYIEVHHTRKCALRHALNRCSCEYLDNMCRIASITRGRFMVTQRRRNGELRYFIGCNERRVYNHHYEDPYHIRATHDQLWQWRWTRVYAPVQQEHKQLVDIFKKCPTVQPPQKIKQFKECLESILKDQKQEKDDMVFKLFNLAKQLTQISMHRAAMYDFFNQMFVQVTDPRCVQYHSLASVLEAIWFGSDLIFDTNDECPLEPLSLSDFPENRPRRT